MHMQPIMQLSDLMAKFGAVYVCQKRMVRIQDLTANLPSMQHNCTISVHEPRGWCDAQEQPDMTCH